VQFQERIQFARYKPRTRFARKEALLARINCKILIARITAILLQFWTKCRAAVLFCRPIPQEACHLGFIKPQMNLRIYHNKMFLVHLWGANATKGRRPTSHQVVATGLP
jgi:hypothetical protein